MKKIFTLISVAMMMLISSTAVAQTSSIGPVEGYGFLAGPKGEMWTYTASYVEKWGAFEMVTLNLYNEANEFVCTIVDSLNFTDPDITGINDAQLHPLVTQKFFNDDDKYEVMLFLHAWTKDYTGKQFNHVFSIEEGKTVTEPIATVDGRQVLAQNLGDLNNENYVMVFARDSAYQTKDYTICYDVRRKAVLGGDVMRTLSVPYANIGVLSDLQPIFILKEGESLYYFTQQYEKPYFVPDTPYGQDPVVTPDNKLVITCMNQNFEELYTTEIPVVQDNNTRYLYTFPMLGNLGGVKDIVWKEGEQPEYIITKEMYNLDDDGSIKSYYKYDVDGNQIKIIAENTLSRIKMSPVVGHEEQWLFMKEEYDGEFFFVNMPSGETTTEISIYLGDGSILSSNIDRVAKGDSYEYAVALLQGKNEADGTISQSIAWLNEDGSFHHYEKINLGKYIETATVYISSDALDPAIFHSDDTREYMAKAKRYNPDNTSEKETILLVCNTNGEILLEYGESAEKGELLDVYLMDKKLMCVYENNDGYTLYYTPLPLNTTGFKDEFYMGSDIQSAKKIVSNGQFYILLQEGVYNATGARLQ